MMLIMMNKMNKIKKKKIKKIEKFFQKIFSIQNFKKIFSKNFSKIPRDIYMGNFISHALPSRAHYSFSEFSNDFEFSVN